MEKKPIIEFKDFSFKYKIQSKATLHDINLTIYEGEKAASTDLFLFRTKEKSPEAVRSTEEKPELFPFLNFPKRSEPFFRTATPSS